MKKSLLISTTFVVLALSATSIYAQVTSGTSIIDRMKAVAGNFTLSSSLNPGQTGLQSAPVSGKKTGDILTAGEWNRVLELISEGGNGGTGAGWENVTLTGTENFDDTCLYRFQIQNPGRQPYVGAMPYFFPNAVSPTQLTWWLGTFSPEETWHIAASSKSVLRMNGTAYTAGGNITKIEKRCGGGGGGSGSGWLALYKCTNAQSLDVNNAPCYGAARNGGAGTDKYRVVSCTDNDGTRSYTMSSILNFWQLVTNKWAVSVNGGTIECDDGTVLVMDITWGGSVSSTCYERNNISLADTYNAGGIALNHNLGSRPVQVEWFVENVAADGGYQPGDRVYAMDFQATSGGEYRSVAFWDNQQQVGMTWDNYGATYKIQFQTKRALGGLRTAPTTFTADSPKWSLGVRACK